MRLKSIISVPFMNRSAVSVVMSVIALAITTTALANVSTKNGNFFMAFVDAKLSGGMEPSLERVFNSKTAYKGNFGWGWGTDLEVKLVPQPDGTIVVQEYGGGATNVFRPVGYKAQWLEQGINEIVEAKKTAHEIANAQAIAAEKTKLQDSYYRNNEWNRLLAKGLVKGRTFPANTQFQSNRFSYQYITVTADGYVRVGDTGRTEKYNKDGLLSEITDKNANWIRMTYNPRGQREKLVDNLGRKMLFTWTSAGFIENIETENGKTASYKYNDKSDLIESKDTDGNVYKYSYDTNHNLTKITYADNTALEVAYYPFKENENVKSVKERDGRVTEYKYEVIKGDKNHYTVSVTMKESDGRVISSSAYEYELKLKSDGELWTYRIKSTIDGDATETVYNECCGLPLIIKAEGRETLFEYDVKGRVTKKATPYETTELVYDDKVGKVGKVSRYSKKEKKVLSWSEFQYDAKGNLVQAKNSEGKGVRLVYGIDGKIMSMMDQNKRVLNFEYDKQTQKPSKISDPAMGTITVDYNNSGEIKKVDSTAGRKIAMQVTGAFNNLLEIIRPAGVSLSQ